VRSLVRRRGSSSIPAWTPLLLSGLIWAGDPSRNVTGTGAISAWGNAAGGSVVLAEGTTAAQPSVDGSVVLNGWPTIKFDGTANGGGGQQLLTTSGGLTGNAPHTLYMVVRCDVVISIKQFFALGQIGTTSTIGEDATTGWWGGGAGKVTPSAELPSSAVTPPPTNSIAIDTSTFHVLCKVSDGTNVWLYVDGYLVATVTDTYSLVSGLGFIPHAANDMGSFHVAYAVAASGAHNLATRRKFEKWARKRFGAALGNSQTTSTQGIFLGDSLTHGTGAVPGTSDWPTQLCALLSPSPIRWNQGVPGQTIVTALTTLWSDVSFHTTGLAAKAFLAIWYGTNDALQNYATAGYKVTLVSNLLAYILGAQGYAPAAPTAVATLTHTSTAYAGYNAAYNPFIDSVNVLLRAVAAAGSWAPGTAYTSGAVVKNAGNFYLCTTGGTSASSGGPTGTGSSISDGSGALTWQYLGVVVSFVIADLAADSSIDFVLNPSLSFDGLHGLPAWYTLVAGVFQAVMTGWA
jgi:lysophospholipase L1-like esterase